MSVNSRRMSKGTGINTRKNSESSVVLMGGVNAARVSLPIVEETYKNSNSPVSRPPTGKGTTVKFEFRGDDSID